MSSVFSASEAGYQAEADSQVRPSEECGPSPNGAMDAGQSVQWQCLCVEPRNTGMITNQWAIHIRLHYTIWKDDMPLYRLDKYTKTLMML